MENSLKDLRYNLVVCDDHGKRVVLTHHRFKRLDRISNKLNKNRIKWYIEDNEGDLVSCYNFENTNE